ncbi:arylesterase [Neisseriaceae bacterium JH1-16]|nr:arylesterase [Neisseriaceae bacterium JH1-16]
MSKALRILLLWCLALPVPAATILVFGDSLSAGYGLSPGQGWVSLLQQQLGGTHQVVNASQSGETTAGGLSRLPQALKAHKPQVVVIELGGNDGLRGLPLAEMRANLDTMIRASRAAGARVLLVGMALPPNYGRPYTEQFHAVYDSLARQHRLAYVPLLVAGFATDRRRFQADGIHPLAAAQPQMMQTVYRQLRPLLKS